MHALLGCSKSAWQIEELVVRQNNKTAQQTRSASGAGVFHSASARSEVRMYGGDFGCWLAEAIPEAWRDEG